MHREPMVLSTVISVDGDGIDDVVNQRIEVETKLAPFRRRHFEGIFVCEHELISHRNSVKCVIKVRINNIPALVQIMAWSDKWWLLYWRIYASLSLSELKV